MDQDGNLNILCDGLIVAWLDHESLMLRDLKFKPDGEVLIHLQQVCWTLKTNDFYPYFWNCEKGAARVWSSEQEGVRIRLEVDSRDGKLMNISDLTVCWSDERQSLLYDVKQTLRVKESYSWINEIRMVNGKEYIVFEYMDPYFMHIVGPATPFVGYWPGIFMAGQECDTSRWRKRWSRMIFENDWGVYEAHSHNHALGGKVWKIRQDGWIGVFEDNVGNPVYRIVGDAAKSGYAEMCFWGYDLHFWYLTEFDRRIEPGLAELLLKPGQMLEVHYEIFAIHDGKGRSIMQQSAAAELTEDQKEALLRPVYVSGVNRFDRGMALEDMHSFPWVPSGKGAVWDRQTGFDDDCSLRLENRSDEIAIWKITVGQEMFMEPLESGRCYILTAKIRLEDVEGKGFQMGVGYGIPKYPGKEGKVHPVEYISGPSLTGSGDWEDLRIQTPPVPDSVLWANISLVLSGKGRVWIDNVEFKPLNA